jgi:hypothetical protein
MREPRSFALSSDSAAGRRRAATSLPIRRRPVATRVLLAALCVVLADCARSTLPTGYAVHVDYPLTHGPDRVAGRLELLEDARIRPAMRTAIADAVGGDPCADSPPPALQSLCGTAGRPAHLQPALLRLLDDRGHVVAERTAERPLAELTDARLYGTERRTFLFTVDLSAGIGSYSGPYTRLAEPDARGFAWLTADGAGGADFANDTITLVATLKTAWRRAPRADGRGEDLLMVMCRPDLAAADSATDAFLLTFERYSFDGGRWVLRKRQERGCYESDEDFPAVTRFP